MNTHHATNPSEPSNTPTTGTLATGALATGEPAASDPRAGLDAAGLDVAGLDVAGLDVAGMIRRVRRTADLSQRDLATLLQVAPATIARWETRHTHPTVTMLHTILDLAGYRLQVIDTTGQPVTPMRDTDLRDHAGRRHPAHLDIIAYEFDPRCRYDRPDHTIEAPRRRHRDRIRHHHATGQTSHWHRTCLTWLNTPEHPTSHDITTQRQHWSHQRAHTWRELLHRTPSYQQTLNQPDCTCLLACHDNGPCIPECDCACEPPQPPGPHSPAKPPR